jgi:RNA polymerase sporulation-specific sigma factor
MRGPRYATEPFPDPLPDPSLFFAALRRGDRDAESVLVARNLRLVAHVARKFVATGADMDDLIGAGSLGLLKAVRTFDPGRGIRFSTYAAICIKHEILMYIRDHHSNTSSTLSLEASVYHSVDGDEQPLSGLLGTNTDLLFETVANRLDRDLIRRAISFLDPKERRVIQLLYGLEDGSSVSQRRIAKLMGISQASVSRIRARAMGKLRALLEDEVW